MSEPKASPIWAVAFSPDGKRIAVGGYREVRIWDLEQKVSHPIGKLSGPVRCLAWDADGTRLAAGSGKPGASGEIIVFTGMLAGADPNPAITLAEHRDSVEALAFTIGGDALLSASIDERALVTDLTSKQVKKPLVDHTNRVVAVAAMPGGKYLLTGSLDKTVKVWSAADYLPLANIDANVGQIYALAPLPAGEQFAVCGEDGNVRIYRLQETRNGTLVGINGSQVRNIGGNRTPLCALAVSAKGNLLASAGAEGVVNVYDFTNGGRKQTLKESPPGVYSVAFSPDGTQVCAGGRDGKVRVWTTADGKLAAEL